MNHKLKTAILISIIGFLLLTLVFILTVFIPNKIENPENKITQELDFGATFTTEVEYKHHCIYRKHDEISTLTDSIVIQRRKEAQEVLNKAIRLDSLVQSLSK